jgi:GntR family transcriptional regulator of arabinose operon
MQKEPKYLAIKNKIREFIENGIYELGDKIPSEAELREEYNVSRHTIRQSIAELVNDGYLVKQQGAGTFVSDEYKNKNNGNTKKTIGVITTYISDYIFPYIIRGIEEELSKENYLLLLSSTRNNVENERTNLKSMIEQGVDGLIVEPTKSNLMNPNLNYYLNLTEKQTPLVMLNASYEELDLPVVALDDKKAGKIATEHLIELGHTNIGMITKADDLQGKNRLKGYIEALYDAKLTFNSEYVLRYDTETKDVLPFRLKEVLSKKEDRPTAFVVYNDEIAVLLIHEMDKAGLHCPEDISIVSHDNSHYSTALSSVKLTSVEHPKEELGKAAAQWIIKAIRERKTRLSSIIFEPELIIRTSTKSIEQDIED